MLNRQHRVALLDASGRSVLVVHGASGSEVPRLATAWPEPSDLFVAVGVTGADVLCPPWREADGVVTHLLRIAPDRAPAVGVWCPLRDVSELSTDAVERIMTAVARWSAPQPDDDDQEWYRPGWREAVDAWVDGVLSARGLARRGAAELIKLWSLSAVLRYTVEDRAGQRSVWFKATCDGFHAEPAITEEVAAHAPGLAPPLMAVDRARSWMLMEDIVGADAAAPLEMIAAAATALARLQVAVVAQQSSFTSAGAPLRGHDETVHWLHEVLSGSVELGSLDAGQRAASAEIEPWLAGFVRDLHAGGIPLTLVHGDLHAANIAGTTPHPIIFDWTDAAIAHPYLDARHLADSAAREAANAARRDLIAPDDADAAATAAGEAASRRVWDAYSAPWRAAYPRVDHDRLWELTSIAEAVYRLVTYEQIYRAQPVVSRWELGGVVVDILADLRNRHASALSAGGGAGT